jgi:mannan polymerase complexes MNN9 subunit
VLIVDRHRLEHQKARRSTLSVARNSLLLTTLAPYISWVLWLDADIIETPPTIIQDLTVHNKDILVANAYQKYKDESGKEQQRAYDFNSWIDSYTAHELAANMEEDDVLFEGIPNSENEINERVCRDSNISFFDGVFVQKREGHS